MLTVAFLLALTGMGFTKKPAPAPAAQPARFASYYWYDPSNNYIDFNDIDTETYDLEDEYGVYVDQNSIGGTLLEKGYVMPGGPIYGFATILLYGHF